VGFVDRDGVRGGGGGGRGEVLGEMEVCGGAGDAGAYDDDFHGGGGGN